MIDKFHARKINYLVEAEILRVSDISTIPNKENIRSAVRYDCEAIMDGGMPWLIKYAMLSKSLGGIGDLESRRIRTRADSPADKTLLDQPDRDASVGERVYILFLNGNPQRPIIVGFKDHPNYINELGDGTERKPQAMKQYLGVRQSIDENGQFRIIRKGLPETEYKPVAASSVPSAPGASSEPDLKILGDGNPALTPDDITKFFAVEMLEGKYQVRDYLGNTIAIDADANAITLKNNSPQPFSDITPTSETTKEPEKEGDERQGFEEISLLAETKKVDIFARALVAIESGKDRADLTFGNMTEDVRNNIETQIGGEKIIKIAKDYKISSENLLTDIKTKSLLTGGKSEILLNDGKMHIKAGSMELLAKIVDYIEIFLEVAALNEAQVDTYLQVSVVGNLGFPTPPGPVNAPLAIQTKAKLLAAQTKAKKLKQEIKNVIG